MRAILPVLLMAACDKDLGEPTPNDTSVDTGLPICDRIHDAGGVLMFEDDGDTVHTPNEAASDSVYTTSIAGPVGDDRTYLAMYGPSVLRSTDGGCNWARVGSLPGESWWQLVVAGSRVYAFDRLSSSGARSDDQGGSWTAFDAGDRFVGVPVADAGDADRLRGVQSRGVVTSSDGGDSWPVSGALPEGGELAWAADAFPGDLNRMLVGAADGIWWSATGGQTWQSVADGLGGTDVRQVAIHPDDADVLFAQGTTPGGELFVSRSEDAGATWSEVATTRQVGLVDGAPLWPLAGDTSTVLSAGATDDGVQLFVVRAGVGIRTTTVGTYVGITDAALTSERWLFSVHAVP